MRARADIVVCIAGAASLLCASAVRAQFDTPNRAFHASAAFRLDGKHQAVPCVSCHLNGQFRGTPNTCFQCHWIRRKDDRFQTRLGTQCEACHRPTSWTAVNWNHAAQTGVALSGPHRVAACEACHGKRGSFRLAGGNCVSCHQKDFDAAKSPDHKAAGFPQGCDVCHKANDPTWHQARFAHTWFPLRGHHNESCESCHTTRQNFAIFSCTGCHGRDTDRDHRGVSGYRYESTACYSCHPTGRE